MNGILSITRDRTREVILEKERDEQAELLRDKLQQNGVPFICKLYGRDKQTEQPHCPQASPPTN